MNLNHNASRPNGRKNELEHGIEQQTHPQNRATHQDRERLHEMHLQLSPIQEDAVAHDRGNDDFSYILAEHVPTNR